MTLITLSISQLPPHKMTPTRGNKCGGYLERNSSLSKTATPTPAEGSIKTFILDQTILVAFMMETSSTQITSSTRSRTIGNVFGPRQVLRPSATDVEPGLFVVWWVFVENEMEASFTASGSARTILHLEFQRPLRATARRREKKNGDESYEG